MKRLIKSIIVNNIPIKAVITCMWYSVLFKMTPSAPDRSIIYYLPRKGQLACDMIRVGNHYFTPSDVLVEKNAVWLGYFWGVFWILFKHKPKTS